MRGVDPGFSCPEILEDLRQSFGEDVRAVRRLHATTEGRVDQSRPLPVVVATVGEETTSRLKGGVHKCSAFYAFEEDLSGSRSSWRSATAALSGATELLLVFRRRSASDVTLRTTPARPARSLTAFGAVLSAKAITRSPTRAVEPMLMRDAALS